MKNGSRASDRAPLRCLERGKKISVSTPEPEPRVRERERNARISNGCKKFLRNFGKLWIAKMRKVRKSVKEGKRRERERENEAENKYSIARFANVPCHVWKEGKSGFLGHASVRSDYESR